MHVGNFDPEHAMDIFGFFDALYQILAATRKRLVVSTALKYGPEDGVGSCH